MQGHAFISYVREDGADVDRIQRMLEAAGVRVWRDTSDLWPGEDWRVKIRQAIENEALVFIACFSDRSVGKAKTYQNEELRLAVDQLRLRSPERPWLIPVRLSDCPLPPFDVGGGKTIDALQRVDLFGDHWDEGTGRLIVGVHRLLSSLDTQRSTAPPATTGIAPLYFGGRLAQEPADLGLILSEHWQAARRVLAPASQADKDESARLRTWLADHDQARALRILSEPGPLERRLVRLIVALAPEARPRYSSYYLDESNLARLAYDSNGDDADAATAVAEIYKFDILGSYPALADTNARWRRSMSTCKEALRRAPGLVFLESERQALTLTLLGCVVGDGLANFLADAVTAEALSIEWFHNHVEQARLAPDEERVGVDVATILLARSATRPEAGNDNELTVRVIDSYWRARRPGHLGLEAVARDLDLSVSAVTRILNSAPDLLQERRPSALPPIPGHP